MEIDRNIYEGKYSDLEIMPMHRPDGEAVAMVHIQFKEPKNGVIGHNVEIPFPELRALVDTADANGQPHSDLGRKVWAVRIATESLGQGHPGIRELAEWLVG